MPHSCVELLIIVWRDSFQRDVTCPADARNTAIGDMTHSNMWYDSFVDMTWLVHEWHDVFHTYAQNRHMSHDSFIHETWLIIRCDMTHPATSLISTWLDLSHVEMSDVTHAHVP